MALATLRDVLPTANREGRAVAGLVCLGWEDAAAYVAAAEAVGAPVILQAGPGARAHTPLAVWGAIFRHLGEAARVPVVAHLDHGRSEDECREALAHGFTSVMFDGSKLPDDENVARTAEVAAMARAAGASVEGEIGFVGYADGEVAAQLSNPTTPAQAARLASEAGLDAVAVSVGNVHLKTVSDAVIDWEAVEAIAAATDAPLVIHGASGVAEADRRRLARGPVAKFNVGTELRQAFGRALREAVAADPARFDRIAILRETMEPVREAAIAVIRALHAPDEAAGEALRG